MKPAVITLLVLVAPTISQKTANAQSSSQCAGLNCDPCPLYRIPATGEDFQAQADSQCVNNQLRCSCADPPSSDFLPVTRSSGTTTASPSPAGNNGNDDSFDTIPTNGGSGTVIPTQSYIAAPSAGISTAPLASVLGAGAALAAMFLA